MSRAIRGHDQGALGSDDAKRIKATGEEVNHIQYGKLLLAAKVGELSPAMSRKEAGAQKGKKGSKADLPPFSKPVLVDYRKLAVKQQEGKIDDFFQLAAERDHEPEVSIAGFLHWALTGNLKAHQNKGVIEWYTPAEWIELARKAMGTIDLDPASCAKANKIVKAKRFYDEEDDGPEHSWWGKGRGKSKEVGG